MSTPLTKLNNRLARGILYLLLLFGSSNILAAGVTLLSTAGDNRGTAFAEKLVTSLSALQLQTIHLTTTDQPQRITDQHRIWVTVGIEALTHHLSHHHQKQPGAVTVALMVTEQQYRHTLESRGKEIKITATFSDPPLQKLINLVQTAIPSARVVGVLQSSSISLSPAVTTGSELDVIYNIVDGKINAPLQEILPKIDVLVTIADSRLYNSGNFRNILLSSYRKRIPMVCHTKNAVTAGCIAGAFAKEKDMLEDAVELIHDISIRDGKTVPPPKAVKKFSVATNPKVAHSLGLHLKHPDLITKELLQFEEIVP